jgi:hypothetical protein
MKHEHTDGCEWRASKNNGGRYCLTSRRDADRDKRARVKAARSRNVSTRPAGRGVIVVDGFEDSYGPVPPPASAWEWYDQVAVDRALAEFRPVGRVLTTPEASEVARIRTLREELRLSGVLGRTRGSRPSETRLRAGSEGSARA